MTTVYDEISHDGHPQYLPLPAGLPYNATSPALAKSIIAKTGIGRLFGFTVTSTNVAAQFILMFDSLTLPGNTTVPLAAFNVAAASPLPVFFGITGRTFTRGIVLANSTTQGTLTLGAADCIFDVQFV